MSFDAFDPEVEAELATSVEVPARYHLGSLDVDGEGEEYEDDIPLEEEEESVRQVSVPDVIRGFILSLQRAIREQNVSEISQLYEHQFNKLSDKYYKSTPWPPVEYVDDLVDGDSTFLAFYKELYYRHIYYRCQVSITDRIESWNNYVDLFEIFLTADNPGDVPELPGNWHWDIFDEFVYQFQSYNQFRSRCKNADDLATLDQSGDTWTIHRVLYYLEALVKKSKIKLALEKERAAASGAPMPAGEISAVAIALGTCGLFAMVSLLRLHCLTGDFFLALKAVEAIDFAKKGALTKVASCQVSLYYYVGFAYMMMRRYSDAIRAFTNILFYINRTKQFYTRSYQFEQMMKRNEQMYSLLAICLALCPQRIEESVHTELKQKNGEKIMRIQRGEESVFEDLFNSGCPKFIAPVSVEEGDSRGPQIKAVFLKDVKQQLILPTIKSYMKLYTSISIAKLSGFLDMPEETFRTQLICLKHKMKQLVWQGGEALEGKWAVCSDVDFFVEKDAVHVADNKVTRRWGEWFIRHINKFEDIISDLNRESR